MWPFEGRRAELSQIRSAFAGSETDVVLLSGPAGIGKTRLAREAVGGLDRAHPLWITATRAAAAIPFGAVAPLLPDGTGSDGSVEVIRATARSMGRRGGGSRTVIVVDDAHLLDDASATLVAHLAAHRLAFLVLTAPADAQVSDAPARLVTDGRGVRIEVPPLPQEIIDRLIDRARADGLDAPARRRLHRLAHGNPLALRELLYGGQLGGLTELITSRLTRLDPESLRVAELVACGEPLALALLERVVGLAAVTRAEDGGVIVVERSGDRRQARFGHPLYGEVLRSRLTVTRATRAYRALARALLSTPLRRRHDTLQAAVWQVEGGAVSRPDLLPAGVRLAIAHADLQLAERLARAGCAARPGRQADRLLAEILALQGRTEDAAEVLPASPAAEAGDEMAWAVTRAKTVYWGTGDIEAALAVLDDWEDHPTARASRSWLLCFDGRCAEAARLARDVLNDPAAEPRAVMWAAATASSAAGFLGRAEETGPARDRGLTVAAANTDTMPWGPFEVNVGAFLGLLAGGRPAEAQDLAAAEYRSAADAGAAMMLACWALLGGFAATARGHLHDAHRLLAEAHAGFAVNDTVRLARCCQAARAAVGAMRGDAEAGLLVADADARAHPSNRIFTPWIETWRAWTAYARGDVAGAIAAARRGAGLARRAGYPAVEALALYDVARLGGRPDPVRLDGIDHDLAGIAGRAVRAMGASDGAADLEAAAGRFRALGYDLHAAEAYTVAGHRHRGNARVARAEIAEAHAQELRAAFPGARTPLLQATRLVTVLSPREREVLLLAAHHTSAEIASRLGLAVATVNNNLARAYTKLGISGRSQLRSLLRTPASEAFPAGETA
ncbi:AAA family ATPase [Planobispora takensis]|uniref:LuxR family transcriptional regulator n=1 Tax=Planobispora takensis TaxID=1367882 RepID=A0A8J3STW3_9ACTN|nr:AAA family ATPase [Planobispora takensis]GIH99465.1 LuxR family transcriptional regulator [Planobispora takensis]